MFIKNIFFTLIIIIVQFVPLNSYSVEPNEILQNEKQELRARIISKNIRCMICQNQSIDESDAELAKDLRVLIRNKVKEGFSDKEIYNFLTERYGDFILLKPALKKAFVHGKSVIIEKYISGRELTVTVLGGKAYPIVEIQPTHNLYDYECKYTPGMSKYTCPADLPSGLSDQIKHDTEKIFKGLGCEVYGRADYMLANNGQYFFLEMNTLPGMTDTSLVPKSTAVAGLSFEKLVKKIIELSQ